VLVCTFEFELSLCCDVEPPATASVDDGVVVAGAVLLPVLLPAASFAPVVVLLSAPLGVVDEVPDVDLSVIEEGETGLTGSVGATTFEFVASVVLIAWAEPGFIQITSKRLPHMTKKAKSERPLLIIIIYYCPPFLV